MDQRAAVTINFPVKPHVYKYLQCKVGDKLIVTQNNFFGATVLDILSKKYTDVGRVVGDLTFPVEISFFYMKQNGIYIDEKISRKFNARIDSIFREEMRSHVKLNFNNNIMPKESALKQFMFHYNLSEEDIKFETLVKDLVRNI